MWRTLEERHFADKAISTKLSGRKTECSQVCNEGQQKIYIIATQLLYYVPALTKDTAGGVTIF